jgi:hypothetical protein
MYAFTEYLTAVSEYYSVFSISQFMAFDAAHFAAVM